MTKTGSSLTAHNPIAVRLVALGGLAWSLFGAFQFVMKTFSDEAGLIANGMTPEQAALYAGLPFWMTAAFAIGTIGGSIGCVLLLARRRLSVPVLLASLLAYGALWAGDALFGVFAAFGPPQVVILSLVVAIALGLWWFAGRLSARRGLA